MTLAEFKKGKKFKAKFPYHLSDVYKYECHFWKRGFDKMFISACIRDMLKFAGHGDFDTFSQDTIHKYTWTKKQYNKFKYKILIPALKEAYNYTDLGATRQAEYMMLFYGLDIKS